MHPPHHLAIVGSGPSAIYLLKHLLNHAERGEIAVKSVSIFEKGPLSGMGMPYNPLTTDRHHLSNISSEELPELPVTFADWLRAQTDELLEKFFLERDSIREDAIYIRLALGHYFQEQYLALLDGLAAAGVEVGEHPACPVSDLRDLGEDKGVELLTAKGETLRFDRVAIASGHHWPEKDRPEQGFYASPWPIHKLLPDDDGIHDFTIGTLGASLSAFDVLTTLAHHHGRFEKSGESLTYHPHPGTEKFRIVMHSAEGILPHLQFEQKCALREIYRHVGREELLGMRDDDGFLRLDTYFDKVARPVLREAFEKDEMPDIAALLADEDFEILDFVGKMAEKHDYADPFKGMRREMKEARELGRQHRPYHWKESLDDLIYTLNYHAEFLAAEDHIKLQSDVMPFLLNVVAAMPLASANIILALHDAGKLELTEGRVTGKEKSETPGETAITIELDGEETATESYRLFVDCSGQSPIGPDDFPFPSLTASGAVRKARARFAKPDQADKIVPEGKKEHLFSEENNQPLYHTGGIDIDSACRLIGCDGTPNPRIHDLAFPHTSGARPYSYGLQACNDTADLVVKSWLSAPKK